MNTNKTEAKTLTMEQQCRPAGKQNMDEQGSADITALSRLHSICKNTFQFGMSQQTQTHTVACQMGSTATMVYKGSYVTPYTCAAVPMQQICNTVTIQPRERNLRNYQHCFVSNES